MTVRYRYLNDDGEDTHGPRYKDGKDYATWPDEATALAYLHTHEGCCGATVFQVWNDQTGWEDLIS